MVSFLPAQITSLGDWAPEKADLKVCCWIPLKALLSEIEIKHVDQRGRVAPQTAAQGRPLPAVEQAVSQRAAICLREKIAPRPRLIEADNEALGDGSQALLNLEPEAVIDP
jgi:hypothetical protein